MGKLRTALMELGLQGHQQHTDTVPPVLGVFYRPEDQHRALLENLFMAGYFSREKLWQDLHMIGGFENPRAVFQEWEPIFIRAGAYQDDPAHFDAAYLLDELGKTAICSKQDFRDMVAYWGQTAFDRTFGQERNALNAKPWMEQHKDRYLHNATILGLTEVKPPLREAYDETWLLGAAEPREALRLQDLHRHEYPTDPARKPIASGGMRLLAGQRELSGGLDGYYYIYQLAQKKGVECIPAKPLTAADVEQQQSLIERFRELDVVFQAADAAGRDALKQERQQAKTALDNFLKDRYFVAGEKAKGQNPAQHFLRYAEEGVKLTESDMAYDTYHSVYGHPLDPAFMVNTSHAHGFRPTTLTTANDAAQKLVERIVAGGFAEQEAQAKEQGLEAIDLYVQVQTNQPYVDRQTLPVQKVLDYHLHQLNQERQAAGKLPFCVHAHGVGEAVSVGVAGVHSEMGALMAEGWCKSMSLDDYHLYKVMEQPLPQRDGERHPDQLMFQKRNKDRSLVPSLGFTSPLSITAILPEANAGDKNNALGTAQAMRSAYHDRGVDVLVTEPCVLTAEAEKNEARYQHLRAQIAASPAGSQHVVVGAGELGLEVLTRLKQDPETRAKTYATWSGHQMAPGLDASVEFLDQIALPQHVLGADAHEKYGPKLVATIGVPHTVDEAVLSKAYEAKKASVLPLPEGKQQYRVAVLGGDAPDHETGEMRFYTAQEANAYGLALARQAYERGEVILATNGPRTGQYDQVALPVSVVPKELAEQHKVAGAHLNDAPLDVVSTAFRLGLEGYQVPERIETNNPEQLKHASKQLDGHPALVEGVDYQFADFRKHTQPDGTTKVDSMYQPFLGLAVVHPEHVAGVEIPGESTSMISEGTENIAPEKVVTVTSHAMNRLHHAHVQSVYGAGKSHLRDVREMDVVQPLLAGEADVAASRLTAAQTVAAPVVWQTTQRLFAAHQQLFTSPEYQALTQGIVQEALHDIPSVPAEQTPIAIATMGAPGAGKSTLLRDLAYQSGGRLMEGFPHVAFRVQQGGGVSHAPEGAVSHFTDAVHISTGDIRARLAQDPFIQRHFEVEGHPNPLQAIYEREADPSWKPAVDAFHKQGNRLSEAMLTQAMMARKPFVFDTTFGSVGGGTPTAAEDTAKLQQMLGGLKMAGYQMHTLALDVPSEMAHDRVHQAVMEGVKPYYHPEEIDRDVSLLRQRVEGLRQLAGKQMSITTLDQARQPIAELSHSPVLARMGGNVQRDPAALAL